MMSELYHHGIRGQKWGKRNGPPYPLQGGQFSASEKKHKPKNHVIKNSRYDKQHRDKVIDTDKTLSTLSWDKNRTSKGDMFFATYDSRDKNQYRAMFNKKTPQDIFDENGEKIGTGQFYKYQITNRLKNRIKVASEDSGASVFKDLYKNKRDFFNFVTDSKRMETLYSHKRDQFRGYREAMSVLNKLRKPNYTPSNKDLSAVYRIFNYALVLDGGENARMAKDIATQRARFFKELKNRGYGAVLDTNDAIYGGYHANAPIIVFDMEQIVPVSVKRLKLNDKVYSELAYHGRKLLHM